MAFELNDFQAYRIFRALASHHSHFQPIHEPDSESNSMYLRRKSEPESEVINEQSMLGFFQSYYEGASGKEEISSILKKEINE